MSWDNPHLISLPYDLQQDIICLLDPLDVLSLQKTCKHMYHGAKDRTLWLSILKNVCDNNSVFLPTHSFETMSLEKLKCAATSPDRFLRFAEQHEPGQELEGIKEWEICNMSGLDDIMVSSIYLVPGGRYLFVFSQERILLLDADLGSLRSLAAKERFIESERYAISTTADGFGLRLVIIELFLDDNDDYRSQVKVYEIYPSSPKPEFTKIAMLRYPSGYIHLKAFSVYGNFVVFIDGHILKVWNFITNKAALWGVQKQFAKLIVTENTVTMVSRNGIFTWRIPDLTSEPSALYVQSEVECLSPDKEFQLLRPFLDNDVVQVSKLSDWYTRTKQNLFTDIASTVYIPASKDTEKSWVWSLARFQLNPSDAPDGDISHWDMPSPIQEYSLSPCGRSINLQSYRLCNSNLIAFWRDGSGPERDCTIKIHISATRGSFSEEAGKQYILLKERLFSREKFSFCPIAGRLCYDLRLGDGNVRTSRIVVIDFLKQVDSKT